MPIKAVVVVTIDLVGDGVSTATTFNVANMETPMPLFKGLKPTGLGNVKVLPGSGVGAVSAVLADGKVTLTFDIPLPRTPNTKVTIEFLYGS
jgi:hypothetical protein